MIDRAGCVRREGGGRSKLELTQPESPDDSIRRGVDFWRPERDSSVLARRLRHRNAQRYLYFLSISAPSAPQRSKTCDLLSDRKAPKYQYVLRCSAPKAKTRSEINVFFQRFGAEGAETLINTCIVYAFRRRRRRNARSTQIVLSGSVPRKRVISPCGQI